MAYAEDIAQLRQLLNDVVFKGGLTEDSKGTTQQMILAIVNDCERRKAALLDEAARLEAQSRASVAQAHAFGLVSSIALNCVLSINKQLAKPAEEAAANADRN